MFKYIFLFAIVIALFTIILDSLLGERTDIIISLWLRALAEIICVFLSVLLIATAQKDYQILYKVNMKSFMLFFLILRWVFYFLVYNIFSRLGLIISVFSAYPINLLVSFELASLLIMNKERGINVNN